MTFKQFDLKFNRKEFIIEDDGLRVISKSLSGRSEDFYDFIDIGDKITREKKRLLLFPIMAILNFGICFSMLIAMQFGKEFGNYAEHFYFTVGAIFYIIHHFISRSFLYLSHKRQTSHIQFLNNKPSKEALNSFIEQLQKIKNEAILSQYAEYDEDKTYEEHRTQLNWLKDNDYLTKEEYKSRLLLIESEFVQPSNQDQNSEIGFRVNQSAKKNQVQRITELLEEDQFWKIIQTTKEQSAGDYEQQILLLKDELLKLDSQEIIEFDNRFRTVRGELYQWDLWAAAYIMNGGCSDDCFSDFRGWLIAQGKEVVTKALNHIEFLAELDNINNGDWEGFSYVIPEAYEQKTGAEMPRGIQENTDITGEEWDEDEGVLQEKFPKIWAKYNTLKNF